MYISTALLPLSLLVLGAVAQSDSSTQSPSESSTMTMTTTSTSMSPTQTCLAACPKGDVNCAAACVGVPYPDAAQVNRTNDCASACVKGDGSKSQSDEYAKCLAGCISNNYMSGSSTPVAVTGTNSAGEKTTGTSGGATKSGSSSSSASATATGNAAAAPLMASAGGLVGLFVAFLAL